MIKILIVDDSKFMRINLEKILSAYPDLQVVGTARNGIEALKFLKEFDVDVIVLDFFMHLTSIFEVYVFFFAVTP